MLGVNRICQDTVFMTGRNPGLYFRICWGFLTPLLMIAILLYTFATYEPLKYKDNLYPDSAYGKYFILVDTSNHIDHNFSQLLVGPSPHLEFYNYLCGVYMQ